MAKGMAGHQEYFIGSDSEEVSSLSAVLRQWTSSSSQHVALPQEEGGRTTCRSPARARLACLAVGTVSLVACGFVARTLQHKTAGAAAVQARRPEFLSLAEVGTSSCSSPQEGMSNTGVSLWSVTATTVSECCDRCLEEASCEGYTFQSMLSLCWLKSSMGMMTPDIMSASASVSKSGARPTAVAAAKSDLRASSSATQSDSVSTTEEPWPAKCSRPLTGMHNTGSVLMVGRATTVFGCCKECIEVDGCKGYTWVHALGKCMLKDKVGKPEQDLYYNTACGTVS